MRYTLLLHYTEMSDEQLSLEAMEEGQRAFQSYAASLDAANALLTAEVLQPSVTTTTVRLAGVTLQVQDGPFADTKDQLGDQGDYLCQPGVVDAGVDQQRQCSDHRPAQPQDQQPLRGPGRHERSCLTQCDQATAHLCASW